MGLHVNKEGKRYTAKIWYRKVVTEEKPLRMTILFLNAYNILITKSQVEKSKTKTASKKITVI